MDRARIVVDASRQIGRIHPHIYGHFIEHLRDCIYGGLWAEMLQNRKFAGHDAHTEEQYGILIPWYAVGRGENVRYLHDNTIHYNGWQSQRMEILKADGRPHGIAQSGLSFIGGREYQVRLVLRQEGMTGPIRVSLEKEGRKYAIHIIERCAADWATYEFSLTPDASVDDAAFSITFQDEGKVWIGAASLMPADNVHGWRRDVLELVKEMKPPIIRYPGGNFVSGYHWMDGIGDRDRRPVRYDYAWNVWEPNDVGIDEFIQLCREVGAEPYISVNAGNGTAEEAAAWVEYCNGSVDTKYGAMRAANGHPEPYGVVYWGIGNEMYGNWQIGHVDPETFGRRHVEFAKAMRAVDPNIKLLAVGDMPNQPGDWTRIVTEVAGEYIGYMTVHHYATSSKCWPRPDCDCWTPEIEVDENVYAMTVAAPQRVSELLTETRRVLDEASPDGRFIAISLDEWNVIHPYAPERKTRQNYALRDGLYAAGMLNMLRRQCRSVTMANLSMMVNSLAAIETSQTGVYGSPTFHVFKLYVHHSGPIALATEVQCDTFDVPPVGNMPAMNDVSYLDCSATRSEDGKTLYLAVVNRHRTDDIEAEVVINGADLEGSAEVYELNGPDALARNSFDDPNRVSVASLGTERISNRFLRVFPAHSVTVLEMKCR